MSKLSQNVIYFLIFFYTADLILNSLFNLDCNIRLVRKHWMKFRSPKGIYNHLASLSSVQCFHSSFESISSKPA